MQIDASKIVYECDGTEINEDTIQLISTETLTVLTKDEIWRPNMPIILTRSSNTKSDTTSNVEITIYDKIINHKEE